MDSTSDTPDWQEFEIAVANFAAALDPSAVVRHNVSVPDADTGRPRQRDVVIEARICRLFPVTVLVSCKYWQTKLDEGDIDTFVGELLSSRAHKGVIYSYSGFTGPALEKAAAKGICCCRLFRNEPPEMPESILFRVYASTPSLTVSLLSPPKSNVRPSKWGQVLELDDEIDGERVSVLDSILQAYEALEAHSLNDMKMNPATFPRGFSSDVEFDSHLQATGALKIQVGCVWKVFQADVEACLVNGSYSLTQNQFVGDFKFPTIDRFNAQLGKGWIRLEKPPKTLDPGTVSIVLSGGSNLRTDLRDRLGSLDIDQGT
jgi:hypothetical protein